MAKTIKTKITADNKDFKKGIQDSQKQAKGFEGGLGKLSGALKVLGGAAAIGGVVKGLFSMASELGKTADRLLDLEQITGVSTDKLQEYEYVAKMAGVSSESMANAVMGLTQRLARATSESSPLAIALKEIGVEHRTATGEMRNGGQILEDAIDQLADMENITERNVLGAQIFGGAWKDLAPILAMGTKGIEEAKKEARDLGLVMSKESLEAANEYRKSVERLGSSWDAVKRQIGQEIIPVLTQLTDFLHSTISGMRTFENAQKAVNSATDQNVKSMWTMAGELRSSPKLWGAVIASMWEAESAMDAINRVTEEHTKAQMEAFGAGVQELQTLIERYDRWIAKAIEAGKTETREVQAAIDVRNKYATALNKEAEWLDYIVGKKVEEVEIVEEQIRQLGLIEGLKERINEAEERYQRAISSDDLAREKLKVQLLREELRLMEEKAQQEAVDMYLADRGMIGTLERMPSMIDDVSLSFDELDVSVERTSKSIQEATEDMDSLIASQEKLEQTALDAAYVMGRSFAQMAQEGSESTKAIISQMLAQVISMLVLQAIENIEFPYNIIAAAGMGAVGAGLFNQVPAFADGGIVYGETLGVMGEYPGARTNPEVIAPLDRLQDMIGGGGGTVRFEISGDKLKGILDKTNTRRGQLS